MSAQEPPRVRPTRWAERLLLLVLPPGLPRDALLGDLTEELAEHAERSTPAAARHRYARQALGIAVRYVLLRPTPPHTHPNGDPSMLRAVIDDLNQGVRSLAHAPGFTVLVSLTLAAGVGATTAIFSVVDGVLLRPLPYADPDAVVALRYERDGQEMVNHSEPELLDYEREIGSFAEVAGWTRTRPTLGSAAEPERILGIRATAALFPLLGVDPLLGRVFTAQEDQAGGERVVVLSHALWARAFAGDRGVIGRTIVLEDVPHTVVGVMPEGFSFPEPDVQAWVPFRIDRANPWARNNHYLAVVARLTPGVSLAAARAELEALSARSSAAYPDFYATPATFRAHRLRDVMVGDVRSPLLLLFGAVVAVLLISSVNAAALFLARGEARRSEMAVRTALGAGRGRVTTQLLGESVLVAGCAAVVGVALAYAGVAALRALAPADLPRLDQVVVNGRVLGFGLGVALLTGVLFGLAPALQALGSDVRDVLAAGGWGGIGSRRAGRFRRGLVVVQLSLATMLALGAGLLLRSFQALRGVETGFDAVGVLTVPLAPSAATVPNDTAAVEFYRALEARIASLPGVTAVGAGLRIPLAEGHDNYSLQVEGREVESIGDSPSPGLDYATPGYFDALGIELKQGRFFDARDRADAPPVAVVNERLAAEFWPDHSPSGSGAQGPLGKRVRMFAEGSPWIEVVGVVADVKQYGVRGQADAKLYIPHMQGYVSAYYAPNRMTLFVRTDRDPSTLAGAVRAVVAEVGPGVPIGNVRPMEDVVASALSRDRFTLLLLGAFAAVALLLASVGVYGVIARAVAARGREFGLRMAVGANRGDIAGGVVREGLLLAALGCGIGLLASLALSRLLESLLFGVSALDPWTYVAAAPLLALTAAAACVVPALRAARLDPVRALRSE